MNAAIRSLAIFALAVSVAAAGLPMEARVAPEQPSCCLLMKQDGCDQQPVRQSEQQQCCAGCVICLALPAEAAEGFVYASNGDEVFASLDVRARALAHRPEVPPPRSKRA